MICIWNEKKSDFEKVCPVGPYDLEGFVVVGILNGHFYLRHNTEIPPQTEKDKETIKAEHKFNCLSNKVHGLQNPGGWTGCRNVSRGCFRT